MGLTETEWSALFLSLKVASLATLIGLPLAIWTAVQLANRSFRGKSLIELLLNLPLVLPPVVIGYALLVLLAPRGPIGSALDQYGLSLAFHWSGAALASLVMAFPLMVRAIRQSLEAVDPALIEAAQVLGAAPRERLIRVTLPLAAPGVLSAAILGFARALGEFGATITFAANIPGLTQTLPLALYTATQSPDSDGPALRLALLCLIPACISLIAGNWIARAISKRMGTAA